MKGTQVAERYARSLFELALERNELEPVAEDIRLLKKICSENRDFVMLLKSPIVQTDRKIKILKLVLGEQIQTITMGFLLLLVRKRREAGIPDIAASFIMQYQDHMRILPVRVRTASPLTKEMEKEMLTVMKMYTDQTIELTGTVDPELVGGFVLSWKDKQYDASISHEIEKMRRTVAKINLYVKEF